MSQRRADLIAYAISARFLNGDIAYIEFRDAEVEYTVELVQDTVLIDIGYDGQLVGIEIMGVTEAKWDALQRTLES